jgi:coenzyme F420 hydrogenase subunit beta
LVNKETVSRTVYLQLCVSCGLCKAICPHDAIKLVFMNGQYLPVINDDSCSKCGLCLKVCPGCKVDFKDIYEHEKNIIPENIFLGHALNSYICYTKDDTIREKAASGGIITSLIVGLLENGSYNGAFVLPYDRASTELAKVTYTEDISVVISACKSKYLPASVENVGSLMKGLKSPIIVGTPCQIYGIKKYCILQGIDYSNSLFLGLFCIGTLNYNFLKYYQWRFGKKNNISKLYYRDKGKDGWPGHTKIIFENGKERFIDRKVRLGLKKFFQLHRCLFCIDQLNQLADISCGDCYVPGEETFLGQSNIIVRTLKGDHSLQSLRNKFNFKEINLELLAESQSISKTKERLVLCNILTAEHNHILYPHLQKENRITEYKVKYEETCRLIKLGQSTNEFNQINKILREEQLTKKKARLIRFIKLLINPVKLYGKVKEIIKRRLK